MIRATICYYSGKNETKTFNDQSVLDGYVTKKRAKQKRSKRENWIEEVFVHANAKVCPCGKTFEPRPDETVANWARRYHCSMECMVYRKKLETLVTPSEIMPFYNGGQ